MKMLAVIVLLFFFALWVYYPNYISEKNQTIYIIGGAALLYQLFSGKTNETTEEPEEELEEEEENELPH